MIVPRSFAAHNVGFDEKSGFVSSRASSRASSRSTSPFSRSSSRTRITTEPRSDPVQIPSRHVKDVSSTSSRLPLPVNASIKNVKGKVQKPRRESAQEILSSTTIPARRKLRGRPSQRLPKCDYVADFSRLLMDDMTLNDGNISRSVSGSFVDGLFGNIDGLVEGQMIVGSEGVDERVLVTRSISSDSLASLPSPEDLSSSGLFSHRSSFGRSYQDKKLPTPELCPANHPLLELEQDHENTFATTPPASPPSSSANPVDNSKKSRSFKSSLTASLKAIKSAAQSVSTRAGSLAASTTDDYLTRSFFDIQPFLTDDKRPPPTNLPPSAQLRRYLNPYSSAPPDSPLQLHFWQEDRQQMVSKQSKKVNPKARKRLGKNGAKAHSAVDDLPLVVPLATCLPPSIRTEHASSPPIWLNPDGTPSNKQTSNPLLYDSDTLLETPQIQIRQREPRENRDFLRIYVCEMAMRKQGKLSDDLNVSRAKLWLPPVNDPLKPQTHNTTHEGDTQENPKAKTGADRWQSWTMDDL